MSQVSQPHSVITKYFKTLVLPSGHFIDTFAMLKFLGLQQEHSMSTQDEVMFKTAFELQKPLQVVC